MFRPFISVYLCSLLFGKLDAGLQRHNSRRGARVEIGQLKHTDPWRAHIDNEFDRYRFAVVLDFLDELDASTALTKNPRAAIVRVS